MKLDPKEWAWAERLNFGSRTETRSRFRSREWARVSTKLSLRSLDLSSRLRYTLGRKLLYIVSILL